MVFADTVLAPEDRRESWLGGYARELFESRRGIVARQLAQAPYMAGDAFTAADISVTYALEFAKRNADVVLDEPESAYLLRVRARGGYRRAMDTCRATKAWVESLGEHL
jgi:glutathione S-transferase